MTGSTASSSPQRGRTGPRTESVPRDPSTRSALPGRVVARAGATGLQAVTLLLLARAMGPVDFGFLAQGLALGLLLGAGLSLGLSTRALQLAREDFSAATASAMLLVRTLTSVVAGAAVLALLLQLGAPAVVAAATGVAVASDQLCDLVSSVLAGSGRQSWASLAILAQRVLPLGLLLSAGSTRTLAAFTTGTTLVLVVAVLWSTVRRVRPAGVRELVRSSGGFWLSTLAVQIVQLDTTLVRATTGAVGAGVYGAAARIAGVVNLVPSALASVYVPAAAHDATSAGRARIYRRIRRVMACYGVVTVLVAPLVAEATVIVLGDAYEPARPLVIAVCIAAALSGYSQALQVQLFAEGAPARAAVAVGTGTVVGLVGLTAVGLLGGMAWIWIAPVLTQLAVIVLLAVTVARHGASQMRLDEPHVGHQPVGGGPPQAV